MYPRRWLIIVGLLCGAVIILDEVSYLYWKKANPGSIYTKALEQVAPLTDPYQPPTRINQ